MLVSLGGRWSRVATTLSLPALTVVLAATSGCRTDGSARPSLSAMSPARWFARDDVRADDGIDLKPIPGGGYDTPPVPPSAPIGRAFVPSPAPAPEADAFYGVRPTSDETPAPLKPSFGEKLRGLFRNEDSASSEPSVIRPISGEMFAPVTPSMNGPALHSSHVPPVPPARLSPPAQSSAGPASIAAHIEPVQVDRRAAKLPTIVARQFPMQPSSEPAPWPYGPAARMFANDEPRQVEPARFAREQPAFLPLRRGDVALNHTGGVQ